MRVAIIGLGDAGYNLHLPALAGLTIAEVVGGCDLDSGRRERAAARWKIPVFAQVDELLDAARPEVVIVATPPDSHADCCLRAFRAGAHVICEKPFAPTLAEADRVIAAAADAKRQLAFNHEFREMPIVRALRTEISRLGADKITFVQAWQLMNMPPWSEPGWRGQLSERTLFEAGIHLLDIVVSLFGEKPRSVQASVSAGGLREERTDAVATVTLEFSRGRLAQIVQNRLCQGEPQYVEVRADTTEASFRASFGGRARLIVGLFRSRRPRASFEYGAAGIAWREQGPRRTFLARNGRDPRMTATRSLAQTTLEAFATGAAPPVSGADARALLEVVAACYRSAESGRRLPVDEQRPAVGGAAL